MIGKGTKTGGRSPFGRSQVLRLFLSLDPLPEGRWNGYESNDKNLPGCDLLRIRRGLFRAIGTPRANSAGEQRLLQRQLPQLLHSRFLPCQVAALVG